MAAAATGARVVKVSLTKTYAHDVKAMIAAAPDAGLFYICNPNNPTGTLTSHTDLEYLVENKPKGSVVMVDEAYIHLCDAPSALDFVKAGKDVVVLRTFSKAYGMAGLRCGFATARPDLLEKIMDLSLIHIYLDGIITSWNTGAERLFGYAAEEAVGQNITLIIPPDRRDEERAIVEQLTRDERVDHFETVRMRKDGGLVDVALTISPMRDAAGRIVGASKLARDITERKRAEEAVRQAQADLTRANRVSSMGAVSYTHLDVYKRQPIHRHLGDVSLTIQVGRSVRNATRTVRNETCCKPPVQRPRIVPVC